MLVSYSFNNVNVNGGLIVDEDQAEECWVEAFGQKSQNQFYKEISQGLPKGISLLLDFDEDSKRAKSMIFSKGENDLSFSYKFMPDSSEFCCGTVFSIYQKSGISKKVQANMFEFMAENGVQTLNIKAMEVGAYAWSRLGFTPNYNQWNGATKETIAERLDIIENKLLKNNNLATAQSLTDMFMAVNSQNPKAMWKIVDNVEPFPLLPNLSWGKVLTLPVDLLPKELSFTKDVNYEGQFDFTDNASISRASGYLYGDRNHLKWRKDKAKKSLLNISATDDYVDCRNCYNIYKIS